MNSEKDIFYCLEVNSGEGVYDYFYCNDRSLDFDALKKSFLRLYRDTVKMPEAIVDATRYSIQYSLDGKAMDFKLYASSSTIDSSQFKLFEDFLSLRERKFKKIKYHFFSSKLLTEKLPYPPPPPATLEK